MGGARIYLSNFFSGKKRVFFSLMCLAINFFFQSFFQEGNSRARRAKMEPKIGHVFAILRVEKVVKFCLELFRK